MSSRRGNALQEAVEQVQAVVRARTRLGVILHGPSGHVQQLQSLDGAVVQVHMRERRGAEVRLPANRLVALDRARATRSDGRKAVVLGGDLNPSGLKILNWMIRAVVTEWQLEGLQG